MITKFEDMDVSMKIMNEKELFEKKFNEKPFSYQCKECGWEKLGALGYNQVLCPKCNSKHIVKNSHSKFIKEQVINKKVIDGDLAVYKFLCKKCFWSETATMFGASSKCDKCGSKDYLYAKMLISADGETIDDAPYIKFNPDRNLFKETATNRKENVQNEINIIDKRIKEILTANKLKETKR